MRTRNLRAICLVGLGLFQPQIVAANMIAIGPNTNNAVFWIDQTIPIDFGVGNQTQIWGNVITVPVGETFLQSISTEFAPEAVTPSYPPFGPGIAASGMSISIFAWTSTLEQPVGPALYIGPSESTATGSEIWSPDVAVRPRGQYIYEVSGNGGVGAEIASSSSFAQLYLSQVGVGLLPNFQPFSTDAFSGSVTFCHRNRRCVASVPEPAPIWLLLGGLVALSGLALKRAPVGRRGPHGPQ